MARWKNSTEVIQHQGSGAAAFVIHLVHVAVLGFGDETVDEVRRRPLGDEQSRMRIRENHTSN